MSKKAGMQKILAKRPTDYVCKKCGNKTIEEIETKKSTFYQCLTCEEVYNEEEELQD
jgi:ribosomal protein L37AE/L43A